MQFFILVLIICLVLFLFKLYHLANDDYVLIKKNISLDSLFNITFVCSLLALLFARIFYIFLHPLPVFLGPLGFLLFPYFPGLSLTGGLLGGILALFLVSRHRKYPIGRVFDFFSMSFLFVLPFGLIGYFLLSQDLTPGGILRLILYLIVFFVANIYLYPKANSLELKDGSSSVLFLIFFSLISLLCISVDNPGISYFVSHRENFILLGILIISVTLIVKQEITGRLGNGK